MAVSFLYPKFTVHGFFIDNSRILLYKKDIFVEKMLSEILVFAGLFKKVIPACIGEKGACKILGMLSGTFSHHPVFKQQLRSTKFMGICLIRTYFFET